MLRWNKRTPRRASSRATFLPTAAGVRLRRRAASAKLPTSALRTKHSMLLKDSIPLIPYFWFTQTIAITGYR
ncbi:hypothetical protein D3C79_1027240 [compost metagenome]